MTELERLSHQLLQEWCDGLLKYQVTQYASRGLYGGILSPAYGRIEGRCGDAVYPFLHMAYKTGDARYLDAAVRVMQWSENNVFFPDGSVVNEVSVSDWRGITVQNVICVAEALRHYQDILEPAVRDRWFARLKLSSEYLFRTITIDYGNINYPACCAYAMALTGRLFEEARYLKKGRSLARQVLPYFTEKDLLLYGEGKPRNARSPKGCLAMDIGYNVEESLPALVLYGLFENDVTVLETVIESLKSHLEFMLPDGAWDNSMGTRNYKWTYWGTRNAEGCQPAYALLGDREPQFLEAATRNAVLLNACTGDGLLYAGPHHDAHGEPASAHHAFCHAKAMATILDYGIPAVPRGQNRSIPRDLEQGIRYFEDLQTWLVSIGPWRATVTGYDQFFQQNGHATGGALSLLWHEKTGPVCVASTTEYMLVEPANMQMDKDPHSMPLTPRLEWLVDGRRYTHISDPGAVIDVSHDRGGITVHAKGRLVDRDQQTPEGMDAACELTIRFTHSRCFIEASMCHPVPAGGLAFILPVVSSNDEPVNRVSDHQIIIRKSGGALSVTANAPLEIRPSTSGRIFHFVPGMEAVPLAVSCPEGARPDFRITIHFQKETGQ